MSALLHRVCALAARPAMLCRVRSTAAPKSEYEDPALVPVLEDEVAEERARQLELSRNKSRLSSPHFNKINGRRPYDEPKTEVHLTVKYNRKMYGKYGAASGVDPVICWPSKKDIAETKEYERVAYPFSIQEMAARVQEIKEAQKRTVAEREAAILSKLTKLEQWKKELNDRVNKKLAETKAAKEKKERLVDEVRRHFGFKLDPKDERFQEMLTKREKEQKKQEKMARREAKEREMLARIQAKAASSDAPTQVIKQES